MDESAEREQWKEHLMKKQQRERMNGIYNNVREATVEKREENRLKNI